MITSLTGPSGVGKTTIARLLIERFPQIRMVPSITTRARRESDIEGEYWYVSDEEFDRLNESGRFIWHVDVHRARYGTTFETIEEALSRPTPSMMILVPWTVELLTKLYPEHYLPFFVEPPSVNALRERMYKRGETDDSIKKRIEDCETWAREAHASGLPYCFIRNDGPVEEAVETIAQILGLLRKQPSDIW